MSRILLALMALGMLMGALPAEAQAYRHHHRHFHHHHHWHHRRFYGGVWHYY